MTQSVRLGDICVQDRTALRPGEGSELRYVGLETIGSGTGEFLTGVQSKTPEIPQGNSFRFGPEHVLYGKLRPYLNKVALPDFEGKCSTEIIPLKPKKAGLDRRYLAYFLRSEGVVDSISKRTSGARMPRADMDFVLGLELPLPSLDEQLRIVDLLSRAEGIVRLRREAQKKAAEIVPALFLDMFGDPAINPRRWPLRPLCELVTQIEGGRNLGAGDGGSTDYRILKVSAVTSGTYLEAQSKPAPDHYVPPASHVVRVGDLLFSRANTVELVGATAIVEETDGKALLPDKLWRLSLRREVQLRYFHALLQSQHARQQLGQLATGTSASMRNVSQAKLLNIRLPIAPYAMQQQFVTRTLMARSITLQQLTAMSGAAAAFSAIQARCFL